MGINLILHHEDFKNLESAWRGLTHLVTNTETDEMLKIRFMDISKTELRRTTRRYKGVAWDQSPIFKRLYEEEYGQLGGEPYGCLVADYYFDHTPPDVELLGAMAKIAAASHAPFIAGAAPSNLQMESWQELANPRDLAKITGNLEHAAWNSLRETEDARYVALAMPRFLGRLPYGAKTNPVDEFNFEEDTQGADHRNYIWNNAAYAMAVSNTASDWGATEWSTPGGRNDVPAGTPDADNDGIPDSAEAQGGTYAGLDLYAMGARTNQRDIFIEVDYMNSTDPGVIPRKESLQKVVESFAAQGLSVHFDAGTQFSSAVSATEFNLGQGSNTVPYEKCVGLDTTTCSANTSNRRSIWDWKNDSFDVRRLGVFHYMLMGNSQEANGAGGSSGRAEFPGNDLIITMGDWNFSTSTNTSLNILINMQASTIMHELGHNLGLGHGGNENTNYKPNYWSVMNYLYQLDGLDASPAASTAYLRWRKQAYNDVDMCALPNSPCGSPSQFIMSYSNGSSQALNENAIFEPTNIGRGSTSQAYADWNANNLRDTGTYTGDLNGDGNLTFLNDYNDWGNLLLPFSRYYAGNSGTQSTAVTARQTFNPVTNDRQPVADEVAPSSRVYEEIRRAR